MDDHLLNPYFFAYNPELLAFENAWVNFMKSGKIKSAVVKKTVADSWVRCRALGLDPMSSTNLPLLTAAQVAEKLRENAEILAIVTPYMESLYEIVKGSGLIIHYVDADGFILKSIGDRDTLEIAEKTLSLPGANRLEQTAGTNSIALAVITKAPIQIAGAEHYVHVFHRWTCSSAPVLNSAGEVICVISVAGRYEMIHQHTLGMVSSVASAIENESRIRSINARLVENNSRLQAIMEMVLEGVVYIGNGKITQINLRMCGLMGEELNNIIGRDAAEAIITTPALGGFLGSEAQSYENEAVIIHGGGQRYSCFLDVRPIRGEAGNEIGKVVIFKSIHEIKVLAGKIKNQAKYEFSDIIGASKAIRESKTLALKAAEHTIRVVLEGESGTGKEMFAQAIHNRSARRDYPFVAVDCGAVPIELLESELFGYEGGAFTGAKKEGKPGVFELADGGTIFFDEIGNMSNEMQQKLLRVLQESVVTRIGGTKQIPVDVRVIAATNVKLEDRIAEGLFRHDLYYRLNVAHIKTPALRDRREDIPLLIESFLARMTRTMRKRVDKRAMAVLASFDWPGNIRQLQNAIEYAAIMCRNDTISVEDLPLELQKSRTLQLMGDRERQPSLQQAMGEYVRHVVAANNDNVSRASKILDISRSTVYKFMREGRDGYDA
ncbi:MAG: sigma-54-dependent Fis family transcriptional regulator [Clostridiales Family XIII bacterium]|jgi:transcriptional regulator of acetoin/glycerol metabolism|nr:sigma-54-dependent Fis family transcriptional regulator [Clostridiales Family XIII bacterium]